MKQKIVILLNCYIAKLQFLKQYNNSTIQQFNRSGQALVTLLVFTATATIVTAGAVAITIINAQTTGKFAQGEETLHIAEAGAENAILRILRESTSYNGETNLLIGDGKANISVTPGTGNKTIISEGVLGNSHRKIQVDVSYNNNVLTITSWREID